MLFLGGCPEALPKAPPHPWQGCRAGLCQALQETLGPDPLWRAWESSLQLCLLGVLPGGPPAGGNLHSGYRAWPSSVRISLAEPGLRRAALTSLGPPGTPRWGALPRTSSSRFVRSLEAQLVCKFLKAPAHALPQVPRALPRRGNWQRLRFLWMNLPVDSELGQASPASSPWQTSAPTLLSLNHRQEQEQEQEAAGRRPGAQRAQPLSLMTSGSELFSAVP